MKKQRSPGGNVLSDDGGSSRNGEHGFGGGRHVVSADGGLRNVRGAAGTPPSSTPSKPSVFGKVGCRASNLFPQQTSHHTFAYGNLAWCISMSHRRQTSCNSRVVNAAGPGCAGTWQGSSAQPSAATSGLLQAVRRASDVLTPSQAWSDVPVSDEEVMAAFKAFACWGAGPLVSNPSACSAESSIYGMLKLLNLPFLAPASPTSGHSIANSPHVTQQAPCWSSKSRSAHGGRCVFPVCRVEVPLVVQQTPGRPIEMDGSRFAKLCRECGVQGGKLNSIAIDIIFSKVKAKVSDGRVPHTVYLPGCNACQASHKPVGEVKGRHASGVRQVFSAAAAHQLGKPPCMTGMFNRQRRDVAVNNLSRVPCRQTAVLLQPNCRTARTDLSYRIIVTLILQSARRLKQRCPVQQQQRCYC